MLLITVQPDNINILLWHYQVWYYQYKKGKVIQWSDPMECGSYKGIKLLEHAMKVVERMFEYTIRQQIEKNDMQFGLIKYKGTTGAISIVRQMQEYFRLKGKKLYFCCVDLEKAFDRRGVPNQATV